MAGVPFGVPFIVVCGWVSLGFVQEMVPTCASNDGSGVHGSPCAWPLLCVWSLLRLVNAFDQSSDLRDQHACGWSSRGCSPSLVASLLPDMDLLLSVRVMASCGAFGRPLLGS